MAGATTNRLQWGTDFLTWDDHFLTWGTGGAIQLTGQEGLTVIVDGDDVSAETMLETMQIERTIGTPARASFTLRGQSSSLTMPMLDDEVQIIDTEFSRTLWGGRVRSLTPTMLGDGSLLDIRVRCASHDLRLSERIIDNEEGVTIASSANLGTQAQALLDLLSGEGFTHSVTIPNNLEPIQSDLRFRTIQSVLQELLELTDAYVTVSPDKLITVAPRRARLRRQR